MRLVILALMLLLAGCNPSNTGDLTHTRDDEKFSVDLKIIPENSIINVCAGLGVAYEANGCTTFDTSTKTCTIYVMPQRYEQDTDRLIIIGHELWHCRYGFWHD